MPNRLIHHPLWALAGQFPDWEAWQGVSGLFYARRRKHSPPVVLSAGTVQALAGLIRAWEASRDKLFLPGASPRGP
jgi:hypothetical protein